MHTAYLFLIVTGVAICLYLIVAIPYLICGCTSNHRRISRNAVTKIQKIILKGEDITISLTPTQTECIKSAISFLEKEDVELLHKVLNNKNNEELNEEETKEFDKIAQEITNYIDGDMRYNAVGNNARNYTGQEVRNEIMQAINDRSFNLESCNLSSLEDDFEPNLQPHEAVSKKHPGNNINSENCNLSFTKEDPRSNLRVPKIIKKKQVNMQKQAR